MLLCSHPTKKGPANVKGVNNVGLWDIDPQRIVIPVLHCPMGLVDKVLESIKVWVNLDVEDFQDEEATTLEVNTNSPKTNTKLQLQATSKPSKHQPLP